MQFSFQKMHSCYPAWSSCPKPELKTIVYFWNHSRDRHESYQGLVISNFCRLKGFLAVRNSDSESGIIHSPPGHSIKFWHLPRNFCSSLIVVSIRNNRSYLIISSGRGSLFDIFKCVHLRGTLLIADKCSIWHKYGRLYHISYIKTFFYKLPQKACDRGFFHVMAFAFLFENGAFQISRT